MSKEQISIFKKRAEKFSASANQYSRKAWRLSVYRISLFIISLIVMIWAANRSDLILLIIVLVVFLIVFVWLVTIHNRVKYKADHYGFLSDINRNEIRRLKCDLSGFDPGIEFINKDHPYHVDLDIFGRNSLFQLLNNTTTGTGRRILADWISTSSDAGTIRKRQEAVKELSTDIEWLQEFQATGLHYSEHGQDDLKDFNEWLESKNRFYGHVSVEIARFIGTLLGLGVVILYILSIIPFLWLLGGLALNSLIIFIFIQDINDFHNSTSRSILALKSLEALVLIVEKRKFKSPYLNEIHSFFTSENFKSSDLIRQLHRLLYYLDNRGSMLYWIFNGAFMVDLHLCIAAEKWKSRQPEKIKIWSQKIGEIESFNSLAAFAFANPSYAFPEIGNDPYHFSAEELGHPLITHDIRVNNNFHIRGKSHVALITGSNMAGKSTFLRTVGINAVLAFSGAPVCAERLTLSAFQVFTSMRTQDNLEEHISSFYAELKRIRQLLDQITENQPVMFFLDEILKGTNSQDRHLGAVSLVHQLNGKNAFGLISTHDLDLANETSKTSSVSNYSFESTIKGDEIYFDYKLQKGICQTLNASKLMEKMGIQLINKK